MKHDDDGDDDVDDDEEMCVHMHVDGFGNKIKRK